MSDDISPRDRERKIDQVKDGPTKLREYTQRRGITLEDGSYGGYATLPEINLNAIAIGFGLDQFKYEPEEFLGLVYRPVEYDVTLVAIQSGEVHVLDAPSNEVVQTVINNFVEMLKSISIINNEFDPGDLEFKQTK